MPKDLYSLKKLSAEELMLLNYSVGEAKALGQDCAWCVGRTVRKHLCLERSEPGEGREGQEQVKQGLVGHWEDLSF